MNRFVASATLLSVVATLTACTSHTAVSRNNANGVQHEAVAPTANQSTASKLHPQWMDSDADQEPRQEAHANRKQVERDRQRATPSIASNEGPRSLEMEKLETRVVPGQGLPLTAAAVGRSTHERIKGFNDEDSDRGKPWKSIGPQAAVFPVATSRTNFPYVTSGRITALAIDPRCNVGVARESRDDADEGCRLYVGAAGGGVWLTDR